jgi:membrane protein
VRLAYGLPARTYLRARAVAFGGSYLLILIFAVLMIAITSASAWASTLNPQFHAVLFLGLFAIAIVVIIGLMSALYFFAIGRGQTRSTLLPGAIFSGVGTVGLYIGLGIFLRFSTGYEAVYGALAGVIIVMLVFYVASYVFLLGALINGQWRNAQNHARASLSDAKI